MGRIRAPPSLTHARHFPTTGGVVLQTDTDIAQCDYVHMNTFEEGLGRIMYVVSALEYERPFLAPLQKFLSIHPRGSVRRVPPHVSFFSLIHPERSNDFVVTRAPRSSGPHPHHRGSMHKRAPHAQASALDSKGVPDPYRSPWYSPRDYFGLMALGV